MSHWYVSGPDCETSQKALDRSSTMIWMQVLTWPSLEVVEVERLTVEPPVIVTVADTAPLDTVDTVLVLVPAAVLSHSSIVGQSSKFGLFNDLQTSKLSKKQLCDCTSAARTARPPPGASAPQTGLLV